MRGVKKVKFALSSRYVGGAELEEIFEFKDDTSDDEIDLEFRMWVEENTTQDTNWEVIEED